MIFLEGGVIFNENQPDLLRNDKDKPVSVARNCS